MTAIELRDYLLTTKVKNIILDTDTFNEVDDQFAIAYAMLSPERVNVLSFNAAPFHNQNSSCAEDGMEKSYNEILKIQNLVNPNSKIPVYKGSKTFMDKPNTPIDSDAARNIIKTVHEHEDDVIIVAIGAITNVASAILLDPSIVEHTAVIWLGGNSYQSVKHTHEFNMIQDLNSARVVFDSNIPLYQVPCDGVCTEFLTTIPELDYYLKDKNELCNYLIDIVRSYPNEKDSYAWSKVIWDVTAVAAVVKPEKERMVVRKRPIIGDNSNYIFDENRSDYLYVEYINRDHIYADLFKKLSNAHNLKK